MTSAPVDAVDRRRPVSVGRAARVELVFAVRHGRTILAEAYGEPPFRIGRPFRDGAVLHLILASSAPGVFGGDRLDQYIRLEPGARVRLTSQSAMQVHPSPDGASATIQSAFEIAAGAQLSCEWDPLIPFAGSRLKQTIDLRLADGGALYWSDAFMSGRAGRGEQWAFEALDHELRLRRGGALSYLERYRLCPGARLSAPWVAGDAAYFGTVLAAGVQPGADLEVIHHEIARTAGLRAAVDALEPDLALARLMADSGIPFHRVRRELRQWFWP
jgi:urease accessory protein